MYVVESTEKPPNEPTASQGSAKDSTAPKEERKRLEFFKANGRKIGGVTLIYRNWNCEWASLRSINTLLAPKLHSAFVCFSHIHERPFYTNKLFEIIFKESRTLFHPCATLFLIQASDLNRKNWILINPAETIFLSKRNVNRDMSNLKRICFCFRKVSLFPMRREHNFT